MGGTWTTQNKRRPGVYLNFIAAAKPSTDLGERGTVCVPAALPWGATDEVITLYSAEFATGESIKKIGLSVYDAESLLLREIAKNAYKILVYRTNTGGVKATGTLAPDVTASAKYAGTLGNKLSVTVTAKGDMFIVTTYLDGEQKDMQTVAGVTDFIANDWINISGAGEFEETAGITLIGGTDGAVSPTAYTNFMAKMDMQSWQTMAVPSSDAAVKESVFSYIKNRRDKTGIPVQAVLLDYPAANYEGIISVSQGYVTSAGTRVEPINFVGWVAGATAGATLVQSLTGRVVTDAVDIIGEMLNDDIETALGNGQFLISRRQDGKIKVEQDINTLVDYPKGRSYAFSKNRVVRTIDDISNQITNMFESRYLGKIDNNDSGRTIFKADIVGYLLKVQAAGGITNFDSVTDITVAQGDAIDAVLTEFAIQPVDAMEKLFGTITLR